MTTTADMIESELADVLNRRLEQLRDDAWIRRELTRALAGLCDGPVELESYEIDYCKIKPGRDINVALTLTIRRPGAADAVRRRFSCTVHPSEERALLKHAEEISVNVDETLRRRLADDGFARPSVALGDPALVLRVFPFDPVLTGLRVATARQRVGAMLSEHYGSVTDSERLGFDVMHYKPKRSCAVHYRIEPANGGQRREAYGKIYRDDRGHHCYELLRRTWVASEASGGKWQAAAPIAHVPHWRFTMQEAVPGRQFRHLFGDLTHDYATEGELEEAAAHLQRIAVAIRAMQASGIELGPENTFRRLFDAQEKNYLHLRRGNAPLAEQIAKVRGRLQELEPTIPAQPLVFSHCDFAHGNVLIDDDGTVGIIDFDKAGLAEPAYDVAYFLTHMWSFGIRHPKRMLSVKALCDDFREAYLELAPDVPRERLALYEALDFAAYVLRNYRKQSHQAGWFGGAEGQVEAAFEQLDVAAGKGGAS